MQILMPPFLPDAQLLRESSKTSFCFTVIIIQPSSEPMYSHQSFKRQAQILNFLDDVRASVCFSHSQIAYAASKSFLLYPDFYPYLSTLQDLIPL